MLRIEVYLDGAVSKTTTLIGKVEIANVSGTNDSGNYEVQLHKSLTYSTKPGVWKRGVVANFKRLVYGPYDLLFLGLASALGKSRCNKLIEQCRPWE